MAKSSRYMMALFGVIAGGRRRQPTYIRREALVSKLYPYLFSEGAANYAQLTELCFDSVGRELTDTELSQAVGELIDFSVRPLVNEQFANDELSTQASLHLFQVKALVAEYSLIEATLTNSFLNEFGVEQVAVPLNAEQEAVQTSSLLHTFSVEGS